MSRIFISYRRSDSISESGRIHDHLEREFGGRNVFKDVDDIQPGYDFRKVLDEEVSQCDVFLAIIGQRWVSAEDNEGNPRLQNPDDFVRIEVESGLTRGDDVLVIPVLINNATMPNISDLPESLHDLTYRNAVIIRNDPDFNRDMRRLIDYIYRYRKQNKPNRTPQIVAGAVVIAIALVIGLLLLRPPENPLPEIVSTTTDNPPVTSPSLTATLAEGDLETAQTLYDLAQVEAGNANYAQAIDEYTAAIEVDPTFANAYVGRALAHSSGFGDYASAISDLEQAVMLDPNYAEAFSYLGQFNFFDASYDDVEINLLRAIELNPSDFNARRTLADYYTSVGAYDLANEQYVLMLEQSDNLEPEQVYALWIGKGYTEEAQEDIDTAFETYQSAIELNPERVEAYANIGNMYVYRDMYDDALNYLDTAYDKASDDPDIVYNRGLAHLGLGNYTEAQADFERVLIIFPNYTLAYIGRGRVYTALGNYVSAVADFGQAIARDEEDKRAYYWRGLTHYTDTNYELAIDDFTTAIDYETYTSEALVYRGLSYAYILESESAIDDFNTAIDYGIDDDALRYEVLVELGWLELEQSDDVLALNHFTQAITLDAYNPQAYEGQATIFITRADDADNANEAINHLISALDTLTRAINVISDDVSLYQKRAEVYYRLGDISNNNEQFPLAIADLETVIEVDVDYAPAYYLLADIELITADDDNLEDALAYAEKAYQLDSEDPDTLGLLADIHEQMSNIDEAIRFYQLAVDNSRDDEEESYFQTELNRLLTP